MKFGLDRLQPLGRALMLPIAVLPVAGLLLRLGQPDLLDIGFIAAAGAAIFDNLGLLFALGIGVGLARDNNGAAGLAGLVCFIVATRGAQALLEVPASVTAAVPADLAAMAEAAWAQKAIAKLSVPIGILSGLVAGWAYNRFSTIRLPSYLAFFGGKRFVPIVAGLAGLVIAALFGEGFAAIDAGMTRFSQLVIGSGGLGLMAYGLLNRLLIVTGLHHILNNVAWFIVGEHNGATGDLNRFFAGDPAAGAFMAGFFPVMMFALPAACLAMYHAALPERRKEVGGMLGSMALTAALTGVTEPIEFTFMFLAPALYLFHALMTGVAMALLDWLQVRLGFGFSAGLFDYVLNYGKATRPLALLPIGLAYAAIYYGAFRFAIARFDLKTPGREPLGEDPGQGGDAAGELGPAYLAALGGAGNLAAIDACTTRLRLRVHDQAKADEAWLKALGARGVLRLSDHDLQVVIGPEADLIAGQMRAAAGTLNSLVGAGLASDSAAQAGEAIDPVPWVQALGGRANITASGAASSRVWIDLADSDRVDRAGLEALGVRMIARDGRGLQLLVADASALAAALQA
ncbi:MAG TPA: N-acetylglucosamine-specific PTS transporter subunit IIBC [Novosphingobium sp.]|nr:N-acetylglucosamine-specific PTS transporter subunit IIBC [Novosphingobium sp.]